MEGDPEFEASQEIPYVDYAAYARADRAAAASRSITSSEIEGAWREALSADRPVIINALTDPERGAAAAAHHLRTGRGIRQVDPRRPAERARRGRSSRCARRSHEFLPGTLRCVCSRDSAALKRRSSIASTGGCANIEHGRFERSLSGLTAFAALVTTAEVYAEHYRASFGNKMMWSPIVVTPPVVIAGIGGVYSKRWAKTVLAARRDHLHAQRPGRRVLPRPRRRPETGRFQSGELQHPDGAADHGPRPDDASSA